MSTDTELKAQRDAAENALRAIDFWLDELGCGYAVEGSKLKPSDVAEAVAQAVSTLRKKLAEERAAHLATRQELSMALAERAHARAEVERLRAERRALAERMREACAEYLKHWTYDEHTLSRVRATPLVTEER